MRDPVRPLSPIARLADVVRSVLRHWPWWALGVSLSMLAIAHGFERIGGLAPCTLCLRQREVYWTAAAVAAAALVLSRTPTRGWARPLLNLVLAGVFAVGAAVAVWHAGAEWGWWPGPAACSAGGAAASSQAMSALLNGAKIEAPRCDQAPWVFLGLSMAGWNGLVSLKLAIYSLLAALRWEPRRG